MHSLLNLNSMKSMLTQLASIKMNIYEEIVFVGRNAAMSDDRPSQKKEAALKKDKLIFESLVDDHGASFG